MRSVSIFAVAVGLSVLGCKSPQEPQSSMAPDKVKQGFDAMRKMKPVPPGARVHAKMPADPSCTLPYQATYSIGPVFANVLMYPTSLVLPAPYAKYYGDVESSIVLFTKASAQRDGFADAQVCVAVDTSHGDGEFVVTVASANKGVLGYQTVHPQFMDAYHAVQAFFGGESCLGCTDCTQCTVNGKSLCGAKAPTCWMDAGPTNPWWWFLPLGLPMVSQQAVLVLDYPPATALKNKDYLGNFTMCRWQRFINGEGIDNPLAYQTIVDVRPMVAAGSGQDPYLPYPPSTFDNPAAQIPSQGNWGSYYITPMFQLLSNPLQQQTSSTLPAAALGGTAMLTWGQLLGKSVDVLVTGTDKVGQSLPTNWIGGNHPDTTAYNCCNGDTTCGSPSFGPSQDLVCNEQADFSTACYLQYANGNPQALAACLARWMPSVQSPVSKNPCSSGQTTTTPPPAPADQMAQCIQEKLDNGDPKGVCCNWGQAYQYCTAHQGVACATSDCNVDGLPPPPQTPTYQKDSCNHYRFFKDNPKDADYCKRCGDCG